MPYERVFEIDLSPSKAEMSLAEVPYSKKQINQAARYLAQKDHSSVPPQDWLDCTERVEAWRASHAHPTRVMAALLRKGVSDIDATAFVSRRLKRMEAIIRKLKRPKNAHMQLTQMQDIGGCRVVLRGMSELSEMVEYCREIAGEPVHDYIAEPKEDGYRCIHFVEEYKPLVELPQVHHLAGRRTEVQIRSKLQHQWATAVETVDFFTRQTLKLGGGQPKWKRFFLLVSSVFSIKETFRPIPSTQDRLSGIVDEAYALWHELGIKRLFENWAHSMRFMLEFPYEPQPEPLPLNSMCLLELNVKQNTTTLTPFPPENAVEANEEYAAKEREIGEDLNRSVVLISVDSITELKQAYPSYYGDAREFLTEVILALSTKGERLI